MAALNDQNRTVEDFGKKRRDGTCGHMRATAQAIDKEYAQAKDQLRQKRNTDRRGFLNTISQLMGAMGFPENNINSFLSNSKVVDAHKGLPNIRQMIATPDSRVRERHTSGKVKP